MKLKDSDVALIFVALVMLGVGVLAWNHNSGHGSRCKQQDMEPTIVNHNAYCRDAHGILYKVSP